LHPPDGHPEGYDENGKAIVSSQGRLPTVVEIAALPGMVFHEVWITAGSPAAIDNGIPVGVHPHPAEEFSMIPAWQADRNTILGSGCWPSIRRDGETSPDSIDIA
jgi:hypothetical protein